MSDEQDVLKKSLIELQAELESLSEIKDSFEKARTNLVEAKSTWNAALVDNKTSIIELIRVAMNTTELADKTIKKIDKLCDSLDPIAKSIESINFPLRLDKIDMAISTQASTIASMQVHVEKEFSAISKNSETIATKFKDIDTTKTLVIICLIILVILTAKNFL